MIVYRKGVLNKRQCNFIINAGVSKGLKKAAVLNSEGKDYLNEAHRKSSVVFLQKEDIPGAYENLINILKDINIQYFKTKIESYGIQLAEYSENNVAFGWHQADSMFEIEKSYWNGRKLTAVFELSNTDDYDGGLLEVQSLAKLNNEHQDRRGIGDLIFFPSFLMHRVTPITRGKRYSLTVWCKGPPWT